MSGMTDFNDLMQLRGIGQVRSQLLAAVESAGARSVSKGEPSPVPDGPPVEAYADQTEFVPADHDWYWQLDMSDKGKIYPHAGNLEMILTQDPRWAGVLGYCQFSYRIKFTGKPPIDTGPDGTGELEDNDFARLRIWLHRQYGMSPPPRNELADALIAVAQKNRFHPVRDYLRSLQHDGEARLGLWLHRVFGAQGSDDYLAAVGTKFLIGAVARVMRPGCKMDNMLILEGDQGKGKSTALSVLFGDWFSDAPLRLGDKDAYQLLQGVWGYELAELDALNKAESTEAKAFLSRQHDRFRPPYGVSPQTFPRQTVALGTTNQDEYLKDYSGNRRYWPVRCQKVDLEWLKAHRDQLWAEALARFEAGEPWWVATEEERRLFEDEQEVRMVRDAWEDPIREWLAGQTADYFTYADILCGALDIDVGHIQRVHQNRLAPIMKHLGWTKARRMIADPRGSGRMTKSHVYVRPEGERGKSAAADW